MRVIPEHRTRTIGLVALAVYTASIPLANWFIQHVGTQEFPGGPHLRDAKRKERGTQ